MNKRIRKKRTKRRLKEGEGIVIALKDLSEEFVSLRDLIMKWASSQKVQEALKKAGGRIGLSSKK